MGVVVGVTVGVGCTSTARITSSTVAVPGAWVGVLGGEGGNNKFFFGGRPRAAGFFFYNRPGHARRSLGLQRYRAVALILEGVHLLIHYVGCVANAAQKQLGVLKNGRANLL